MEANKVISTEGLKWRCRKHTSFPGDIICLDGDLKDRIMCFMCHQINSIPASNLISMNCILAAKEHDILEAYPPLKDQELSVKLRYNSLQQSRDEIDLYFKNLRTDFEREVNAAQQRAKQFMVKQEQARQQVIEGYIRIAEIQKLKQLIVSNKEGAEKDLDEFIKDKWNKAEQNRKIMQDLMDKYDNNQYFSPNIPNKIAQTMIDSLKSINFYEQSIKLEQKEVNIIKSTNGASSFLSITQIENSIYQIKQETNGWGQVFLDPILNPMCKYIFQIELETKLGSTNNFFQVGIMKNEGKDNDYGWSQEMCYYDMSNCNGITKYIKGNLMQSGTKQTGKHSFEFRVYLDQKLLRVASLPDYSSIAELDDPNKIDPKVNYRFFLALAGQGNMIRIKKVSIVDNFDEKM